MISTGYSPRQLFSGEIVSATINGDVLSFQAVPGGTMMDRPIQSARVQAGCNHRLFSKGCTLLPDNWKFTATLSTPGLPGWPFTFGLTSLARVTGSTPTYTADWFAGGWIEIGADITHQRYPIMRSTMPSSGALTITLGGDPDPFPVAGTVVTMFPGCDRRGETCVVKFGNYPNFRGYQFVPVGNPVLTKRASTATSGKK